jgi:hypothetical protein
MLTLNSHRDVRHVPEGSLLIIVERFGRPYIERLILKAHRPNGFVAAPIGDLNADRFYECTQKSFAPSEAGFALTSPLGQVAVRFEVKAPPKRTTTQET